MFQSHLRAASFLQVVGVRFKSASLYSCPSISCIRHALSSARHAPMQEAYHTASRITRPYFLQKRFATSLPRSQFSRGDNTATAIWSTAWIITILGLSYAAVPLYRAFCQATGYGGTVNKHDADRLKVEDMVPIEEREITVRFNADTSATMPWSFKPQQNAVTVVPGETALAFFTAANPTNDAITGISTYNVVPFEEQRLNPKEEVDMPVFFYLDPEFAEDPNLMRVKDVTLSYTFFKSSYSKQ
eukprot:gene9957-2135_t